MRWREGRRPGRRLPTELRASGASEASIHPQPAGTERPAPRPGFQWPQGGATRGSSELPLRTWRGGGAEAQGWSRRGPEAYSGRKAPLEKPQAARDDRGFPDAKPAV